MLFLCVSIFAQKATEIYLLDLKKLDSTYVLSNPVNISDNKGYDNQPCFTEDGSSILFASNRDGQTDIARYDIVEMYRTWLTDTKVSEYSPAPYFGKKKYFTCVRFEEDNQTLFKYGYSGKDPVPLISNIQVGYYVWFDKNIVITFVLGDTESLQVSNFKYKIKYPIAQNIGRSLNKIPNPYSDGPDMISFISKSHGNPEIYAINPLTSDSKYIVDAIEGSEDLTWTVDGSMLMARDNMIYKFDPKQDKDWIPIVIESEASLNNITRLVVSPNGKKIAIVTAE